MEASLLADTKQSLVKIWHRVEKWFASPRLEGILNWKRMLEKYGTELRNGFD